MERERVSDPSPEDYVEMGGKYVEKRLGGEAERSLHPKQGTEIY